MEQFSTYIAQQSAKSDAQATTALPLLFRMKDGAERILFEDFIATHPSVQWTDTLHDQLRELIVSRNIGRSNNKEELELLIKHHIGETPEQEYGVWVYYPWLNRVVHLLEEEEFIELRTNRNQHKITKSETALLRTKRIGIIGLSVGQSIAATIALERCCGELRIADFDTLELTNLNRIRTGVYNLGIKKVTQIAREISELDPFIKLVCYDEGITENNLDDFLCKDGKLDLVIEECDELNIKIETRIKAKKYAIPVLMETNDRGMIDIERFDLIRDYPLLHGILEGLNPELLKGMTTEQKVPVMMKLVGFNTVSPRGKLTLLELGQSVATWPQLASSVILGAGVVTDVARRIILNHLSVSGRFYVDAESIIKNPDSDNASYVHPALEKLALVEMKTIAGNLQTASQNSHSFLPLQIIETIVKDAGLAPSSGNDQPWKFLYQEGQLFLFYEKERAYSFGNYKDRAAYLSIGAAIENAVLSAHHQGLDIQVQLFPQSENKHCIAVFSFSPGSSSETHRYDELYSYIQKRHTGRAITENEAMPDDILQELTSVSESVASAKASFITDKTRLRALGSIVSESDRIRLMNPQGNYEFFHREMRWTPEDMEATKSGIDASLLGLPPQVSMALQLLRDNNIMKVLRDINGLQAFKNVSTASIANAGAMGLITMPSFSEADFINGGRSAQRQWLKATALGYGYQPVMMPLYLFYRTEWGNGEGLELNIFNEVNEMRSRFLQIFPNLNEYCEVWMFRIFKAAGNEKNQSLRLPLTDILFT